MDPANCVDKETGEAIRTRTGEAVSDHAPTMLPTSCHRAVSWNPIVHLATKLDVDYSSIRSRIKLAETIGVITVARPARKGVMGHPHHTALNNWDRIEELKTPSTTCSQLAQSDS